MKHIKLSIYELIALGIIVGSVIIRLALISQNWPWTDSDEGTYGIMAIHIAYQGAHPIFMYGAFYMGALQAYLGALMFHIFGPSLFSLRLGLLLLFVLFLVSLYLLTRALYSPGLALVTIALLSLGSNYLLTYQLRSYGGYPDTLFFGTLMLLIASWLAISSRSEVSARYMFQRCLGFGAWGLAAGLGIWSDQIILPFVAFSGLLLLLFCWRELLRILPTLCILLCLAIGMFPLIYYNLHAPAGHDSLHILLGLQGHNRINSNLLPQLRATFQVSIPTITGEPLCPVNEVTVLRDPTSTHRLSCTLIHSAWSLAYLALFASAIVLAAWTAWQAWRNWHRQKEDTEARPNLARHIARLFLLGSAVLALSLYVASPAPIGVPANHARYIIGLLIATPAVLWPLWLNARTLTQKTHGILRARSFASALSFVLIGIFFLTGTIMNFQEIPTAQLYARHDQALIAHLESMGVKHIYTSYWTCDKLAFLSQEKIICGVVVGNLFPTHNRYQHYYDIVKADPYPTFVFNFDDFKIIVRPLIAHNPAKYRVTLFEGWYIVQTHALPRIIRKIIHSLKSNPPRGNHHLPGHFIPSSSIHLRIVELT